MYGLKLRNANGITIVDENYKNFTLRRKFEFTHTRYDRQVYHLEVDLPASAAAAVAFRSTGGWCGIYYSSQIDATTRRMRWASWSPITVTVYIFDSPVYADLVGTWGLRIRNRFTKEIAFDSRGKYMKVLAQGSVTTLPGSGNYNTFAFPGKTPAVIFMQPYAYVWSSSFDAGGAGNPIYETGRDMMQAYCTGDQLRLWIDEWWYQTGGSGGIATEYYNGSKTVLIVDVTGF
nr:hypothetical protein [uncultured Pseudomonas sp.]